jgi:urease gamma subunit
MMHNFPVCAEGFELRASEGQAIISFYLLRNAHDGKGGEHMMNQSF